MKVPRPGDGGHVARGPAPGPGRTGRGHPAVVSHTGRGPPGSTAPGPQASSGAPHWAGLLTTAQGCQQMGKLAGAGLQHGPALHASAGSIPLCPRAVVCCLVPPCALLALGGAIGHWVWLHHSQWGCMSMAGWCSAEHSRQPPVDSRRRSAGLAACQRARFEVSNRDRLRVLR